ncbi:hypothetical protein NDU88_003017 [Pleurodeles waltl]|uniref:Uncharacterized protein n=1 Tax=Pleurodeles waltl TaxID=8319 RepID=A0AAV7RFM7_PLEWA|nr:hypothetical protein NDU88_003017 [Pleurodeles waltl]
MLHASPVVMKLPAWSWRGEDLSRDALYSVDSNENTGLELEVHRLVQDESLRIKSDEATVNFDKHLTTEPPAPSTKKFEELAARENISSLIYKRELVTEENLRPVETDPE